MHKIKNEKPPNSIIVSNSVNLITFWFGMREYSEHTNHNKLFQCIFWKHIHYILCKYIMYPNDHAKFLSKRDINFIYDISNAIITYKELFLQWLQLSSQVRERDDAKCCATEKSIFICTITVPSLKKMLIFWIFNYNDD